MAAVKVVFDGPPSHEFGRFVEVEDDDAARGRRTTPRQRGRYRTPIPADRVARPPRMKDQPVALHVAHSWPPGRQLDPAPCRAAR
jgi:hypothetical protein